jgi:uncharacterized protein YdaU (DUF1376 family)
MAKDLPYFKFFCSEWNDGDITLETYEHQGLFINICSYYWSNECNVPYDKLLKRFRGCDDLLNDLSAAGLFKIVEGRFLSISFLDEQREERELTSKKNSDAGKLSAKKRALKKLEVQKANELSTETQRALNLRSTKTQPLREEEIRREEIRKETVIEFYPSFIDFWNLYDKKVGKEKTLKKWNTLKQDIKEEIIDYIPNYKASKTEKQYLQNPLTFLNSKTWNDEIIIKTKDIKDDKQRRIDELANRITQGKPKTLNIEVNSSYE